jgi:pyruvate-ferredoxin/flavodoxin oxidoreductase
VRGCGETPYIKLMTQLFGDRTLIANATGCSSIYGGNLPTTPYTSNRDGRGPAWSNSLFEDNAEFGLGMRLASTSTPSRRASSSSAGAPARAELAEGCSRPTSRPRRASQAQRERGWRRCEGAARATGRARPLEQLADYLVKKSVWIVGGDGWAYDIGYGGLDHVLAVGRNVNILVLDTEVYSNTGGQQSKATPMGAAAKFADRRQGDPKKDLGLLAMSYGTSTWRASPSAPRTPRRSRRSRRRRPIPGPSLIIAYSHCIAHGYDMAYGLDQQKLAVDSGLLAALPLRPRRVGVGERHGSVNDVPGIHPRAPADAGRLAARRRSRHRQAPRGRRRVGHRDAVALRGADRARRGRARGYVIAHHDSFAEAMTYLPAPDEFVFGPDRYLEHLRRIKGR